MEKITNQIYYLKWLKKTNQKEMNIVILFKMNLMVIMKKVVMSIQKLKTEIEIIFLGTKIDYQISLR